MTLATARSLTRLRTAHRVLVVVAFICAIAGIIILSRGERALAQVGNTPGTTVLLRSCVVNDNGGSASPAEFLPTTLAGVVGTTSGDDSCVERRFGDVPEGMLTIDAEIQAGYFASSTFNCLTGFEGAPTSIVGNTVSVSTFHSSTRMSWCEVTFDDIGPAEPSTLTLAKCIIGNPIVTQSQTSLSGYATPLPTDVCPAGTEEQFATPPIAVNPGIFELSQRRLVVSDLGFVEHSWTCTGFAERPAETAVGEFSSVTISAGEDVTCLLSETTTPPSPVPSDGGTFELALRSCLIGDDGGDAAPGMFLPSTVAGVSAAVGDASFCPDGTTNVEYMFENVPTGPITITADTQPGYAVSSPWDCNTDQFHGNSVNGSEISVGFDFSDRLAPISCTIVFDDLDGAGGAMITLVKCLAVSQTVLSNAAQTNLSGWLTPSTAIDVCPPETSAQAATSKLTVSPGPFQLSERGFGPVLTGGSSRSDWSCVGGADPVVSPTGRPTTVTLEAGQDVTCQFTLAEWTTAKLIKCVDLSGAEGASAADFVLSGNTLVGETVDDFCPTGTDSQASVFDVVDPGLYALTEVPRAGYSASGWTCTGPAASPASSTDASTTIVLALGDDATCVITNTRVTASASTAEVTLVKCVIWNGATGAAAQESTLSGQTLTATAVGAPCPPGTDAQAFTTLTNTPTGVFTLSESTLTGYTASGWTCTGSATGPQSATATTTTLNLAAGDTVTCHVTNTENASTPPTTDKPPALPSMVLQKAATFFDANDDGSLGVGETVTFVFDITNKGDTAIDNVVVNDPFPGLSDVTCPASFTGSFQPNDEVRCIATYVVTPSDIARGLIRNTATVTGDGPAPQGGTVSLSAQASVSLDLTSNPVLSIENTVTAGPPYVVGQEVGFDIRVTNTGGTTLTD